MTNPTQAMREAILALLAEIDEKRSHDECGECPPTAETESKLRASVVEQGPLMSEEQFAEICNAEHGVEDFIPEAVSEWFAAQRDSIVAQEEQSA